MQPIYIIMIEDEAEVMDALLHDLSEIEAYFPIEVASSAEEAKRLIQEMVEEEKCIGLVLSDHILPGENGVDFLIELAKQDETRLSRKVLVTGQASHNDTIKAVNDAGLDHYISKPWTKDELVDTVRNQLSKFIMKSQMDPMPFLAVLQSEALIEYIRTRGLNAGAE